MAAKAQPAKKDNWQKEYAPRVTRRHLALLAAVYGLWVAFLATLAVSRWWLGSLQ